MSKVIVVGPPFAGKSTLVRQLRTDYPDVVVMELDEMLIEENSGKWPTEEQHRNHVLMPKLIGGVIASDQDFIFVTTYISPEHIREARSKGDVVVQLTTEPSVLISRNVERDTSRQSETQRNLEYQQALQDENLVDVKIDASMPTTKIARQLVDLM